MNKRRNSRVGFAIRVAIAGMLLFWGGWSLYQSMQPKTTQTQPSAAAAGEPTKKSEKEKAEHTVPADHPRQLIIDALNIDANILPMGVTKDGTMEAPVSAWDVGWYTKSALPGTNSGSTVIDGHINDTLNQPGVFYSLTRLIKGDQIVIERGDGLRFSYSVTLVEQIPLQSVTMSKLLDSPTNAKEGLSLITCGGTYDEKQQTYTDRVVVRASKNG